MKYILISILLLLIGYGVTKTETKEATTVDSILIKSEQTFAKASNVCIKADEKQKQEMIKIQEKVLTLQTQNKELKEVIISQQNEIKNLSSTPVDTGEQFNLFSKD
jgi:DsbC/DsbD-like thiol-disulfide interchange protein